MPVTPSSPALITTQSNDVRAPTKREKITGLRRGQGLNPPKFQIFSQSSNNSSNNVTQAASQQTRFVSLLQILREIWRLGDI